MAWLEVARRLHRVITWAATGFSCDRCTRSGHTFFHSRHTASQVTTSAVVQHRRPSCDCLKKTVHVSRGAELFLAHT